MNQPRRRVFGTAVAGLALALLAAACVPVAPPPPPQPPGLNPVPPGVAQTATPTLTINKTFVTNVLQPWDIAFAPDGTMLYTEKSGGVFSFASGVKKQLGTVTATSVFGEGGLMGLAVDPTFPTNPYVYVCTTTASDNRIIRLTVDLTRPANAGITAQTDLVTGMQRAGVHNGCRVRFQPGSSPLALFWSMGDAATGTLPQNPSSMNGKTLRAQVVNGAISPHPNNPSGTYVFTSGHRNPQGVAFNPSLSNAPYSIEHGPGINDEVHMLVAGGNSGWDPVPGYNQGVPMSDLGKFPGSMNPVWRSGDVRTIAPSGGTFIQNIGGADWEQLNGALIIAVLKDSELRVLLMNPDGTVSGQFQLANSTGVRLRSVVQSPVNGKLYVAEDVNPGQIWEITPS